MPTIVAKQDSSRKFGQNEAFIILFFLVVTSVCYWPALGGDFMSTWDDNMYIRDNTLIRSLSPMAVKQIFTSQVGGSYVPLTLISFAVEFKIWGLNPLPYHVTNLVLHLLITFLVYRLLRKLKISALYAGAAALIYGIHPMGVESVAWVTERKDLLYSVFYFGSLLLYIYYVQSGSRRHILFISSLLLFILALFSKIQAVSLPLVLLVADYYFERRGWSKILIEKIPYLVLSLIFGIAGIYILRNVGALKINEIYTFSERLFFGSYALSAYVLKFFIPTTLSALHPYPVLSGNALPVLYYLSPLFIVLVGLAVYLTSGKTRAIVTGSLIFLFPVIFMLQIFGAGQGFLADRFTKVPYMGMVFITGWGLAHFCEKWRRTAPLIWMVFAAFSIFLMISAYHRCKVWKNGETLWTDVIEKYPERDARPYTCRGVYYREIRENDKALTDFNRSHALRKNDSEVLLYRGNIYFEKGMDDSAYMDYLNVLKIKTDNALALSNLGAIYVRRGQFDSAVLCLSRAIRIDPGSDFTYANRAVAYDGLGKTEEAIDDFKHYLTLNPEDERVYMSIAMACSKLGRYRESLEWFDKAILKKPTSGNFYYYRSQTYKSMGDRGRALADALRARDLGIKVSPEYIKSLR